MLRRPKGVYEGPVCYVPWNQGKLKGGWHYSTRINRQGHEVPHRRLYHNPEGYYEYAKRGHLSYLERHGQGKIVHMENI